MDSGQDVTPDAAWAFLWGKRRWRRLDVDLDAAVQGRAGKLRARAVNVSLGGCMLRIPRHEISRVLAGEKSPHLLEIQSIFHPEFDVRFTVGNVTTRTELVRISWHPDEPTA